MIQTIDFQPTHFLPSTLLRLANTSPLSLVLTAIAGTLAGMLINYLADVLPKTRRFSKPRCPECETPFNAVDYLLLRKCPNCGKKRSLRTYIVLFGTIIASLLLQFFPFAGLSFWSTLPLMIFLGTVVVIDIEHRLVLAETSLFGIFLCLVYGLILHNPTKTLLGGLNGLLIMLFFYVLGITFSFIIGRLKGRSLSEVAFGFGDVLAGTFLGLLTGWQGILGAIIIALLAFVVFSTFLILWLVISKRYRAFTSAQPFVPFLIAGTIVMFYL
jgi:hypothetical protein